MRKDLSNQMYSSPTSENQVIVFTKYHLQTNPYLSNTFLPGLCCHQQQKQRASAGREGSLHPQGQCKYFYTPVPTYAVVVSDV